MKLLLTPTLYWMAVLVLYLGACTPQPRDVGRFPVGVTTVSFLNSASGRPFTAEVWYPATNTTVEVEQNYGSGYLGLAHRDAPSRLGTPYPLLVLSHGVRGTRYDLAWLAEGLAADGFIVAAVDHPGSDNATFLESESPKLWVRAHALSAVIDGMLHHSRFAGLIDPSRIAAAGHSLGGSTVLVLAGAQVNPTLFAQRFPEAGPCSESDARDRRVHAVIAIAPGTAQVFDAEGVAAVGVPALVVSGNADWHTPEQSNAAFYAAHIAHSEWHSVPGAGHYTFKPVCTTYARFRAANWCRDKWSVNRAAVHREVVDWSRTYLHKTFAPQRG